MYRPSSGSSDSSDSLGDSVWSVICHRRNSDEDTSSSSPAMGPEYTLHTSAPDYTILTSSPEYSFPTPPPEFTVPRPHYSIPASSLQYASLTPSPELSFPTPSPVYSPTPPDYSSSTSSPDYSHLTPSPEFPVEKNTIHLIPVQSKQEELSVGFSNRFKFFRQETTRDPTTGRCHSKMLIQIEGELCAGDGCGGGGVRNFSVPMFS